MKLNSMMVGAAALMAMGGTAWAQAPAATDAKKPPEYVSIVMDISVDKPIDVVMKKTGDYCAIGTLFKTTCTYTSGTGGVGTVRLIAGRVVEVMVAKTDRSYTYEQPPSFSPIFYHGTVEYVPDGQKTKIVYTLFYDDSNLADQAAKDKDQTTRRTQFTNLLKTMKSVAEAP